MDADDSGGMQRIGECVDCGLPLPLLRPPSPRDGSAWVCSYCGCHYHAMLDESAGEDLLRNVRPVEMPPRTR